jgi:hypothetical protein
MKNLLGVLGVLGMLGVLGVLGVNTFITRDWITILIGMLWSLSIA